MSLDLTGQPFPKPTPPCEMCIRFPLGGYDWNCDRCEARKFVRATPAEQEYTRRLWQESMPEDEFERRMSLVAEEQASENKRREQRTKRQKRAA